MLVQEKRSIYFVIELTLREISYVLNEHALICARYLREYRAQLGCAMQN